MSNRSASSSAPDGALARRQAVAAFFRQHTRAIPPAPESWKQLNALFEQGFTAAASYSEGLHALRDVEEALFVGYGREAQAKTLWREALATAAYASQLADIQSASIAAAACGGLLHRAGEAFAIGSLARAENSAGVQLDAPSAQELISSQGQELAERIARDWKLSAPAAACMLGWRQFGEFSKVSGESAAVYFGHLLAVELLHPEFTAPGALDAAGAEFGLNVEALEWVRGEGRVILDLIVSLE
jgi:hypothetical protein